MYHPFANTEMILIGNGVMGKRHAARLSALGTHIERIADDLPATEEILKEFHPERNTVFALIASPASTHAEYARKFLTAGCPVFVEKPLAMTAEAEELVTFAKSRDLPLFVGHSERYHPVVPAFANAFDAIYAAKSIAEIRTQRNAFSERCRDVSVIFDLLIHDLDLLYLLLGAQIVRSVQIKHAVGSFDSVSAELTFANGICVKMNADRKSEKQTRRIAAYSAQGEELCMADFAVQNGVRAPAIPTADDALAREYRAFAEALHNPQTGYAALDAATWAVSIAEKIQKVIG